MTIVSYSQYPTDDKKYECRTGPFEGFFVCSVEFCKHIKFDDKKRDSKIGPQGPPRSTRLMEHKVHQVLMEHKVHQVHKVLQVLREFKVYKVHQELLH